MITPEERWELAEADWRQALTELEAADRTDAIDSEIREADDAFLRVALARRPDALNRLSEIFAPTMVDIIRSGDLIDADHLVRLAIEDNAATLHECAARAREKVVEGTDD